MRPDLVLGHFLLIFALQFACTDVSLQRDQPSTGGPASIMSTGADRREARRFTMTLPLRVLPRARHDSEVNTATRDVSYRGLYFLTETNFESGKAIEFVITLPQDITGGDVKIRCQGEIVRVEPASDGRMGVAAKIAHYEFIPTASVA